MLPKPAGLAAVAMCAAAAFCTQSAMARTTGGGEIMTNEKVVSLVRARISDSLVIRMIKSASRTQFDVTSEGVLQLKEAGASEDVISAMMDINDKESADNNRQMRISIQLLRSPVQEEYDRAVRELVRFGAYAVPLLVENCAKDDERIRAGCYEVLGRIADPPSLDAVFMGLQDRTAPVRQRAAKAISQFDKEVVGPRLARALETERTGRDGFALALGYLRDVKYLDVLLKVADSPADETDRAAAAYALGVIGDPNPDVIRVLIDCVMSDIYRDLREASARALGKLSSQMDEVTRARVAAAMAKSLDRYSNGRDIIALQMRNIPTRRTVEILLEYVGDRDRNVSVACWESLKAVTGEDMPRDAAQWRGWWELASGQPRWQAVEFRSVTSAGSDVPAPTDGPADEVAPFPGLPLPSTSE